MNVAGFLVGWLLMGAIFAWARHSEAKGGRPALVLSGCIGSVFATFVWWILAVSFGQHLSAIANVVVAALLLVSIFFGFIAFAKAVDKLGLR